MKYSFEYKLACVELYREGKWEKTPNGITDRHFHNMIRKWAKTEKLFGVEGLKHPSTNRIWNAEEKYELVAKVLAGATCKETAIHAGIEDSVLLQWVRRYKMKGYEGLAAIRKGRPPKEPQMQKKETPVELTSSEREELIRLRAEIEYLKAENLANYF